MLFNREIYHLLIAVLLGLFAIALVALYWVVIGPERILPRDDNPRLFEARAAIERGLLVDRNGIPLVTSLRGEDNRVSREYLYTEMNSILGYYSLRYGVGGAEAAFDSLLNGDDFAPTLQTNFEQGVLHRPQQGADVRLTLDLETQQQIGKTLADHTQAGAIVLLSVPRGEVLAAVSLPTYNPNKLNQTWDTLVAAPEEPFFNRALQANYQPGGTMYTLLLTAALIQGQPLTTTYDNATATVEVGNVEIGCTIEPPSETLTLTQAHIYGCPEPFRQLAENISLQTLETTFDLFRLDDQFTLEGFTVDPIDPEAETNATPTPSTIDENGFQLADVLGQGELTITPLHMAALTALTVNGGNAPQPYALSAMNPPYGDGWQDARPQPFSLPITTNDTAQRLQTVLRQTVSEGTAQAAATENLDIGGQAAFALSGERTLTWFTGFARRDNRQGVVVALVLEDVADLDLAAQIGGLALAVGMESITPDE